MTRWNRIFLAPVAISLFNFSPTASAEIAEGFFFPRSQYPLEQFHNNFRPESAEVTRPGEIALDSVISWSNTYNTRKTYLVDEESRESAFALSYGLAPRMEVRFETSLQWRGGGVTDSLISRWDKGVGFPNRRRERREDNLHEIRGTLDSGSMFSVPEEELSIGDIFIGSKYLLNSDGTSDEPIAALFETRLPTSTDGYGQDSFDFTLSLIGTQKWNELTATLAGGASYFNDIYQYGVNYKHYQAFGYFNLDYNALDTALLHAGISMASSQVKELSQFPDLISYLDLGVSFSVASEMTMMVGFRENLFSPTATTDFTGFIAFSFPLASPSSR